jgi:hypothetical protein
MPPLPQIARTSIARFVTIDDRTIVQISRYLAPDAYCDPPAADDLTKVWGSCFCRESDSFREIGTLESALRDVAPIPMIAAAAVASPRGFASMVATAYDLAGVLVAGSFSISYLVEQIENVGRFCAVEATHESLKFHTFQPISLFGPNRRASGIYAVTYSLTGLCIERNELVAPYPVENESRPSKRGA